jgi:hypothetical protein
MARPGWPERNRAVRSFRQLRRFHRVINSDKAFGTHTGSSCCMPKPCTATRTTAIRSVPSSPISKGLQGLPSAAAVIYAPRVLRRPFNWGMLQTSFDHLASQLIGVLMNGWVRHEFIFARSFGFDLLSNVVVVASKPLVRHSFDAHSQLLLPSYCGGFSSPASQPTASVFMGSIRKEIFSVQWQVLHSKVRCSKPRSPREIRANPILCLQVGHIGRSAMERELRIPHPSPPPRERAAREYVPAAHRAQNRFKNRNGYSAPVP